MSQPPPQQPQKRATNPLQQRGTRPLGDAFVSSQHQLPQPRAAGVPGTRPLTGPLKLSVQQRLSEVDSELGYIQHLLSLFYPSVVTLRYAEFLSGQSPQDAESTERARMEALQSSSEPDPESEMAEESPPETELAEPELTDADPEPFLAADEEQEADMPLEEGVAGDEPPAELPYPEWTASFTGRQGAFALKMADVLRRSPKVLQRAKVALFQYDEASRAYSEGLALLEQASREAPEMAWGTLDRLGLERIKGKAYPISVFYEQFKGDPVLNQLFPPPQTPASAEGTPASPPEAAAPSAPQRAQPGIQIGNLQDRAAELKERGTDILNKFKGFLKKE